MTFTATTPHFPRMAARIFRALANAWSLPDVETAVHHLDDRLRMDAGLPPLAERPLQPHEAAARIAMMALR